MSQYNYHAMSFLTKDECNELINYYKENVEHVVNDYVTLTGRIISRDQDVLNLTDRDEPYTFFQQRLRDRHDEICEGLGWDYDHLKNLYETYCREFFIDNPPEFENKIKTYEVFLSRYGVGKYCAMHRDNVTIGRMFDDWYWTSSKYNRTKRHKHPRLYIVSLMLNDDYEGGELVIVTDENTGETVSIKAEPGQIVIMEPKCIHEVKEVTAGERYVLISWAYIDNDVFIPVGAPENIFDLDPRFNKSDK